MLKQDVSIRCENPSKRIITHQTTKFSTSVGSTQEAVVYDTVWSGFTSSE